jgi:N-acetylglutamate synthase/N-acetylornithine aminotransferase
MQLIFFIQLSSKIVKDGEGATKIIKLNISNAKTKTLAQEHFKKNF